MIHNTAKFFGLTQKDRWMHVINVSFGTMFVLL